MEPSINTQSQSSLPVIQGTDKIKWVTHTDMIVRFRITTAPLKAKAIAKIKKGDTILGYLCQDDANSQFAMRTEDIKHYMKATRVHFYNLRLTSNNKLQHDPKGDRYGLNVSPEVFFNYTNPKLGIKMYYSEARKSVVILDNKKQKHMIYKVQHKVPRTWDLLFIEGDMIDRDFLAIENLEEVSLLRDTNGILEKFVERLVKLVALADKHKAAQAEIDRKRFYDTWAARFDHFKDYHEFPEDNEEAYRALTYLKRTCAKYGEKWDLDF